MTRAPFPHRGMRPQELIATGAALLLIAAGLLVWTSTSGWASERGVVSDVRWVDASQIAPRIGGEQPGRSSPGPGNSVPMLTIQLVVAAGVATAPTTRTVRIRDNRIMTTPRRGDAIVVKTDPAQPDRSVVAGVTKARFAGWLALFSGIVLGAGGGLSLRRIS